MSNLTIRKEEFDRHAHSHSSAMTTGHHSSAWEHLKKMNSIVSELQAEFEAVGELYLTLKKRRTDFQIKFDQKEA